MIRWIKKLFTNSTSDSVDKKKMHALSRISSPMPPKHMIYHENLSIERTSKLKQAFPPEYESCVIQRVLIKNPHWSLNACHWYMYEWKRFFVLASIFKEVDMFSEEVDEIWHEALMFSRDYEKLCHMFAGSMIHHVPHTAGAESISCSLLKRTEFFLYYNALFPIEKTSMSKIIWNMQEAEKLDREWLSWFLQQTTETVIKEYIRPQAIEIFDQELIERLVATMFAKAEQLGVLRLKQQSLPIRKQSIRNNGRVIPETSLKANGSQQSTSSDMYWINSAIIAANLSNDTTNDCSDKNHSTPSHSCSSGTSCGSSCSSGSSSSCSSSSCSSSSCSSC